MDLPLLSKVMAIELTIAEVQGVLPSGSDDGFGLIGWWVMCKAACVLHVFKGWLPSNAEVTAHEIVPPSSG